MRSNTPCRATVLLLPFLSVLMLLGATSARAQSASNEFWQAQSIYQIVTDRFFDGDASNNNADGSYNASGQFSVHGGDFRGVEQKLDYIKALGATAIWISPIVLNANGEFHGYAGRDFYNVAPHWGTLADLQHFTAAAHARGLLVIDDIIVNHGGDLVYSTDAGYSSTFLPPPNGYNLRYRTSKQFAAPFNTNALNPSLTNLFHNNGSIQNYGDDTQVVYGELSGLDDFRTESAYVRSNMAEIYKYWISQAGFDGFRIDTVKHVEMGFWQNWCPNVHSYAATNGKPNFFMFGETLDGSESKVGSYTGTKAGGAFALDSMLDYPLFFALNGVFANNGATKPIEDHYNSIAANYDPAAQMRLVTFLDNHDQPRFLSYANNNATRLQVATAFLYTSRGVPCLYYGTEQGFNGTTDPNDREDMFDGQFEQGPSLGDNFNMTHQLFLWVAKLNNFRRLYPALKIGSHVNKWNEPGGAGLFAYARRLSVGTTQEVFVVFNTDSAAHTLTNRSTSWPAGTPIVNLFDTNETLTVTATPEIPPIATPGNSVKIFVAQADWRPLDPLVISNSPLHDAASVPTYSPIILRFNNPMDTNSVQSAFSITPAVAGSFSWSPTRDTLTFTAGGTGLAGLSAITVRLTNSAFDTVSGHTLYAPYELKFKTAATSVIDTNPPVVGITSPSSNAVISGALNISGTAMDNITVQKVEVRLDNSSWMTATGTTSWSFTLNSSNFLNGPHTLSARSTDTSSNVSSTNSIPIRFFNVPGAYVQRLSGGNPSNVTDCIANVWLKDAAYTFGGFGYSGGQTGFLGNTITGVCASAQSLYQRERYSTNIGGFFYQFDCPAGIYETTILEAETYWSAAGQRVFNTFIQGTQVLTNLDILAAAGGKNLPLTRTFTNSVTNSQLRILFAPVVDNARVSGVQVRKLADVFSDSDGIPDWWRLGYFGHPTGQAGDQSRGADDADNDGASNFAEYLAGTDPLNASSVFKIVSVQIAGADVRVICSTVTTRTYHLQRADIPEVGAVWSDIGVGTAGNGGNLLLIDTGGATGPAKFYRVRAH